MDCLLGARRPEAAAAVSFPVHPVTHTAAGARPVTGTPIAASTPEDKGTRTASVAGPVGLLLHGPETPSEPVAPSAAPAALAAVGASVTGLRPHIPEKSPEQESAIIGPQLPTAMEGPAAVGISAARLPPNKPEGPPGPRPSPMGTGILAVLGTPILVGAQASTGPPAVSLSPHRLATLLAVDSSRTGLGVLGTMGTPPAVDTSAVCLLPGKPVSIPRGPDTLAAVDSSVVPGTLVLGLLPQNLGTHPGPVSSPSPGASGTPIACLLPHNPGKPTEPASSRRDHSSSGAAGTPAATGTVAL
ncbi:collagen alpha-2(I) chain-like [Mustela erminea]|uniref:collagen alpha-2(I) chain-like n=1 Tax=Mustela erminea TaxID=36723 RepID=UPI001386BDA6|nr:collagen alpha-2(I) chain-like [Mustela erminea]